MSIHCCTQSSHSPQSLAARTGNRFAYKIWNNVHVLMFDVYFKCFWCLIFDITQLNCQLRKMGGLVITVVIIYPPWQYRCFVHDWGIVLEWILWIHILGCKKSWKLNSGQRFQKSAFPLWEKLICKCACNSGSTHIDILKAKSAVQNSDFRWDETAESRMARRYTHTPVLFMKYPHLHSCHPVTLQDIWLSPLQSAKCFIQV